MVVRLRRFQPRDLDERGNELPPFLALGREHGASFGRDAIVAAAALARPLHPSPANQLALPEPVERGVERREREMQRAAGTLLDLARDVVAVQIAIVDEREDQRSALPFFAESMAVRSSRRASIYRNASYSKAEVRCRQKRRLRPQSRAGERDRASR